MNSYANDSRVRAKSPSQTAFTVDLTDRGFAEPGLVWVRGDGTWVASSDHGSYRDFATADEAIYWLIGDPQ